MANEYRISQEIAEVAIAPSDGKARVSQDALEVAIAPSDGKARTSQTVLEVASIHNPSAALSQIVLEVAWEAAAVVGGVRNRAYILGA